jgi:hypothetical protein
MKKPITVASLVMGVGALVVLIFSFLDFYTLGGNDGTSAWDTDGLFPASIIPVMLGVAMLVFLILDLVGVKLPEKVLTFTWPQIYATLGVSAAVIMIGWLLSNPYDVLLNELAESDSGRGVGLILMLLGSLAMAAGSIMSLLGVGNNTLNMPSGGSGTPSAPRAPTAPPPGGAYPPSAPGFPPSAPPPPPPPSGGTPPPPPA